MKPPAFRKMVHSRGSTYQSSRELRRIQFHGLPADWSWVALSISQMIYSHSIVSLASTITASVRELENLLIDIPNAFVILSGPTYDAIPQYAITFSSSV